MGIEENKVLMRRWHDEMNRHNAAVCDELLADGYSERNNMSPQPLDRVAAKALLESLFAAIPVMHREIIEQVAEGDTVVERLRYSGTQRGEMFGIPPTGRRAEFDAVMVSRIRDGRIRDMGVA
jgi:predicted ester cyclase